MLLLLLLLLLLAAAAAERPEVAVLAPPLNYSPSAPWRALPPSPPLLIPTNHLTLTDLPRIRFRLPSLPLASRRCFFRKEQLFLMVDSCTVDMQARPGQDTGRKLADTINGYPNATM